MGQEITSVTHMVSMAGDLRRAAKQPELPPDHAAKLQRTAANLETAALAKVGQSSDRIGKLLDLFV